MKLVVGMYICFDEDCDEMVYVKKVKKTEKATLILMRLLKRFLWTWRIVADEYVWIPRSQVKETGEKIKNAPIYEVEDWIVRKAGIRQELIDAINRAIKIKRVFEPGEFEW